VASITEAEARATLVERGGEGAASLASAHGEANEVNALQAWDMAEAKLPGFSDGTADVDRWWEDVERQCEAVVQELTLCKLGLPICE
jgi:hypothetical protein